MGKGPHSRLLCPRTRSCASGDRQGSARLDAPGTKRTTISMSHHDKKDVIHDVEPAAWR